MGWTIGAVIAVSVVCIVEPTEHTAAMAKAVSVGFTAGAPAFPLALPLGLPALFLAPFSVVLGDLGDLGSAAAAVEAPSVHPPAPS